jgi:hypothetical protein
MWTPGALLPPSSEFLCGKTKCCNLKLSRSGWFLIVRETVHFIDPQDGEWFESREQRAVLKCHEVVKVLCWQAVCSLYTQLEKELAVEPAKLTSVSLRLAVKSLAEVTCGTVPRLIRVAVIPAGNDRTYAVAIPFEYRTEIYQYLAEHTTLALPPDGGALILDTEQALVVVNLARAAAAGRAMVDEGPV